MTLEEIILLLQKIIADETQLEVNQIDPVLHLGAFGLNSINSIYVLERLENELHIELNPLMFYDYPTIQSLGAYINSIVNP